MWESSLFHSADPFFFPFPFGKPDNVLRGDLEFDLRPKVKNAFSLTKPLHHDGTYRVQDSKASKRTSVLHLGLGR